jgi:hypothetical protein
MHNIKHSREWVRNDSFTKLWGVNIFFSIFNTIWSIIRQAMYVWRNTEPRSRNQCCHGKLISIIYSEYVLVALVIQHAMRIHRIVICGLSGSAIFFQIFSQIAWFSKKKIWNKKYVFWFSLQLLSETFLILRKTRPDTVTECTGLHVKCPLLSLHFNESWIFSTDFRKTLKY